MDFLSFAVRFGFVALASTSLFEGTSSNSDLSTLYNEAIINTINITTGNAKEIIADCKALIPPTHNKSSVIDDKVTPQNSFSLYEGDMLPLEVCIERTSVAESAEDIK